MEDVCLFAHFDKDDRLDDYVLRYLATLKELNFAIILISTSHLVAADMARAQLLCDDVIFRENTGLDFASWSAGFAKHGSSIRGRLLLANDSVYGPIGSLKSSLDRLTRTGADFYGMVESVEIAPHLQSWFVLLQPQVVRSAAFSTFMAQPFAVMSRPLIIRAGEVGLTRQLTAAGFRYAALYPRDRSALVSPRHDANPMLLNWRELLFDAGVPFLKIELLRDNPIGGEGRTTILQKAAQLEAEIGSLISAHLARTAPEGPTRPQRTSLARHRYTLMRRYEEAKRERRHAAAALLRLQLEILAISLTAWRLIKGHSGRTIS
jgi:lipopolysaccharide biosynthesis protein